MFIWKDTGEQFKTYDELRRSVSRRYKIHSRDIYIQVKLNGVPPVCKCGCGQTPKWRAGSFQTYLNGHNSKINNNMSGKTHSKKARTSISQKRKEKFANGEYTIWQNNKTPENIAKMKAIGEKIRKENNPERGEAISKALTGRKHTKEHREHVDAAIKKAWKNPELREKQSHNRMLYIAENGFAITSKLEDMFEKLLLDLKIQYHRQHYVRDIKALYDFYLSEYNIIVETHGDFWHCKPGSKYEIPVYDAQFKNIENDKKKEKWCFDNKIPLLIFWESDINDRPAWVISQLLSYLYP